MGFFTHCIAVHEENAQGFSTLVFQTCEVGVVAIEVVCALRKETGGEDFNRLIRHCSDIYYKKATQT